MLLWSGNRIRVRPGGAPFDRFRRTMHLAEDMDDDGWVDGVATRRAMCVAAHRRPNEVDGDGVEMDDELKQRVRRRQCTRGAGARRHDHDHDEQGGSSNRVAQLWGACKICDWSSVCGSCAMECHKVCNRVEGACCVCVSSERAGGCDWNGSAMDGNASSTHTARKSKSAKPGPHIRRVGRQRTRKDDEARQGAGRAATRAWSGSGRRKAAELRRGGVRVRKRGSGVQAGGAEQRVGDEAAAARRRREGRAVEMRAARVRV